MRFASFLTVSAGDGEELERQPGENRARAGWPVSSSNGCTGSGETALTNHAAAGSRLSVSVGPSHHVGNYFSDISLILPSVYIGRTK
jgi:hypothetical protein